MSRKFLRKRFLAFVPAIVFLPLSAIAQTAPTTSQPPAAQRVQTPQVPTPTQADILRGAYGPYRANNDLLYYHLDIRVDPEKKFISGKNTIRFKMLKDDTRIQLDLTPALSIDKILLGTAALKYERQFGAVFVDFPETVKKGHTYSIDFYYSGTPVTTGRFGVFTFGKDPQGHPWIYTACEGIGASMWWPNKDQWRDEVENMRISVSIPNDLVDVSNGKFVGKTDLGDGYTRWDWFVHYPINNYDVALNIGNYVHFSDRLKDLPLDFYVLPEDLDKAKKQFAQARGMLEAYEHYFGEYPFKKDGYKLVQVPYAGMEHQSAVAYGNHFANGYYERDWTGVGISLKFDFIIIHESGHEWFGNSVTAADPSDMWIHEGWTTYLESLYVEYTFGHEDAIKYLNGYKSKVKDEQPIIAERGVNAEPPQDMYFKGALFINTLRSIVNDDARWWKLLHDFYQHFKYKNIMTEDVVAYFNQQTGMDLTPIFNQYLRHTAIPTLELKFDESAGTVAYRWKVDEPRFAMPIRVGKKDNWQTIQPTTEWKTMPTSLKKEDFEVATDLYYVNVTKE
ncbi:MAG TPA: M1 family metallopeptidase [Candidatus Acidoferrales bacterium]|nr:M1 family metallopeptidase [Candidatus Acidoferrales bacterium]